MKASKQAAPVPVRRAPPVTTTEMRGAVPFIQAKLQISRPGDAQELEADRVADQVLRMPGPSSAGSSPGLAPIRPLSIRGRHAACEDEQLQREAQDEQREGLAASGLDSVAATLRQSGRALNPAVRAFFEPRYGVDFSAVRIHTDSEAAASARAINALAYTVGSDVVFDVGQYAPHRDSGRRLLAHELAHVVQQRGGAAVPPLAGDRLERATRNDAIGMASESQPGSPPLAAPGFPGGRRRKGTPRPQSRQDADAIDPLAASPLRLQRQPAGLPSGSPIATTTTVLTVDPDAEEQRLRTVTQMAGGRLPLIDREHRTPLENDAAAQALVIEVFGGEDGLNAKFETLADEVIAQVDADAAIDVKQAGSAGASADPTALKTANRARFLARVRLYFDSWEQVLDHFRHIERVSDGPIDVFLHHSAAVRLHRAIAVLKSKGHGLPRIGGGFQLRKLYRGMNDDGTPRIEHFGMMIHAMGFAFDAFAKGNPRIAYGSQKSSGPERQVQDLLSVTIGPKNAHMDLESPQRAMHNDDFIDAMGRRTADDTVTASDDSDPVSVEYFRQFEQQFNQMRVGSAAFKASVPKAQRDTLLKLRNDYFTQLKAMAAERKKGRAADRNVIARLQAQRVRLLAAMPLLVGSWAEAIDKEIEKELAKRPGMEDLRSPSVITAELRAKEADVTRLTGLDRQADAGAQAAGRRLDAARSAIASAKTRRDAARAALDQARAAPRITRRDTSQDWQVKRADSTNVDEARTAAAQADIALARAQDEHAESLRALEEAITKRALARIAKSAAEGEREGLQTEFVASNRQEFQDGWRWVERLDHLRDALTKPDLSSDAGVRTYERLMTGDLSELGRDAVSDNPPLLRLLDIGFFNPDGDFDLAFFEEMAHSGFWPGASWNFGSVDSMHFELVEGRHSLKAPGK